jgi:hypothetical protein
MKTLTKPEQKFNNKGFYIDETGQGNNFAIEPKVYVDDTVGAGWTKYAEQLNGRLAMIGFVALLATEILSGNTLIGLFTSL